VKAIKAEVETAETTQNEKYILFLLFNVVKMVHPILLTLEIILTTVIIGAVAVLYRSIGTPDVRFRLRFLIAAFSALLIGLILHSASLRGYLPGTALFYEHVLDIIFFTLLGATGLLHFLERKHQKLVAPVTYAVVGFLLSASVTAQVYFLTRGTVYQLGTREIIIIHGFQVAILLLVTGIILRRILVTHSYLTPLTLHRRYPFGIAVVLMMLAVVAHIGTLSYAQPSHHLISFFESALVLPALTIISIYIIFSYKTQINLYGRAHLEGGECNCDYCTARRGYKQVRGVLEALNHVIRQVYYGPVDVGIGAREVLFSEFLGSTGLVPFFSKNRMELRRKDFLRASEDYDFIYHLSEDILKYFDSHKEMVNDAQFQRLIEFLDSVYARGDKNEVNFKPHWLILSRIAKTLGKKAEEHLERLSGWDPETTLSYFKNMHPTGIRKRDLVMGGLETHQFLLNISKDAPKLKILHPVIKSCLGGWRNVIYITSDPVAKIEKDLGGEMAYLEKGRLRVITLLPRAEVMEEKGITVVPSPSMLVERVGKSLGTFPLGAVFIVIDMNPIAISEPSSEVHEFIKLLSELRYRDKLGVCAFVSKNIHPLSMDILREEADIVIQHELISGDLSSVIVKPDISAGKPLEKDLFKVLRLVYNENSRGKKPSISEISSKLSITPKTAKKRVTLLREKGLVTIEKWGRYKVMDITEDGRQVILQERQPSSG
jgi:DNA-binding MarR family transcriptional regulator